MHAKRGGGGNQEGGVGRKGLGEEGVGEEVGEEEVGEEGVGEEVGRRGRKEVGRREEEVGGGGGEGVGEEVGRREEEVGEVGGGERKGGLVSHTYSNPLLKLPSPHCTPVHPGSQSHAPSTGEHVPLSLQSHDLLHSDPHKP